MVRVILFFCWVGFLSPAYADLTGAGDMGIIAKLAEQLRVMNEELEATKDHLSIQKNLEQLKQNELIKSTSQFGADTHQLLNEASKTEGIAEDFAEDPTGTKQIEADIKRVEQKHQAAQEAGDVAAVRRYASILVSLKRMKWLAGSRDERLREAAEKGQNSDDATKTMSAEIMSISQMLSETRAEKIEKELRAADSMTTTKKHQSNKNAAYKFID